MCGGTGWNSVNRGYGTVETSEGGWVRVVLVQTGEGGKGNVGREMRQMRSDC